MTIAPALKDGYRQARELNAQHGKTYYLATLLLPRAKRPYVHALYGFARSADDIVDDLDPGLPPDERSRRFRAWSEQFLRELDSATSSDPVTLAVLDTIDRWQIPAAYFRDFLSSMAMDLDVTEYETHADLISYMWGSAAVIALQMLPILGYVDESPATIQAARSCAIDLGLAFQLTNFLRDVSEDLTRGRIYLPQDSLRRHGVDREQLLQAQEDRHAGEAVRALIAHETNRTRRLYRTAATGIELLDPTSRDCMRTALTLYSAILTQIENQDYDVFSGRAQVSSRHRARVAIPGLVRANVARWS
jgi:phytoene synthase